jgi:hypothetical protein
MDALSKQVPLADCLRLVKRPGDERLTIGSPYTAADGLLKVAENPQTLAVLQGSVSIVGLGPVTRTTYIGIPELRDVVDTTAYQ